MEKLVVRYKEINYELNLRRMSNAKKIRFRVYNGINVTVPSSLPLTAVRKAFLDNAEVLIGMLNANKSLSFSEGAGLMFLGKRYRLQIIKNDWPHVEEIGEKIVVFTPVPEDEEYNRNLYIEFLRARAKVFLPEIVAKMYPLVERLGADRPTISVRRAKTRWGSCRKSTAVISLNLFLMNMPTECIEYVVLHELVHIIHSDHSENFWNTVRELMPDYENRKQYIADNIKTEIMVVK